MTMTNQEIVTIVEKRFKVLANQGDSTDPDILLTLVQTADWLLDYKELDSILEDFLNNEQLEIEDVFVPDFEMLFTDSNGTVLAEVVDSDDDAITEFYRLTTRNCDAGGYPTEDGGFVVLSGSIASPDTTRRFATRHPGSFQLRQDLITDGSLSEQIDTGKLLLTRDMWFETPARAASVLAGQICGSDVWWLSDDTDIEVM